MKKRPLQEGTVFLVPLRNGGYAPGLLARWIGDGRCFGYFFGPKVARAEDVDLNNLDPDDAILKGKFGDLEILRGNWPTIGLPINWDRARWGIPPLARVDEVEKRAWVCVYDDRLICIEEKEVSLVEAAEFPYDRMMGAGAVEIRLTKLLQH